MAEVIGGRGKPTLGKRMEGPYQVFDPATADVSVTVDRFLACQGAKAVVFHIFTNTAVATTIDGVNPRGHIGGGEGAIGSVLQSTAAGLGVIVKAVTGNQVDVGAVIAITPAYESTDGTPGARFVCDDLGIQLVVSASTAGVTVNGWIIWD